LQVFLEADDGTRTHDTWLGKPESRNRPKETDETEDDRR